MAGDVAHHSLTRDARVETQTLAAAEKSREERLLDGLSDLDPDWALRGWRYFRCKRRGYWCRPERMLGFRQRFDAAQRRKFGLRADALVHEPA